MAVSKKECIDGVSFEKAAYILEKRLCGIIHGRKGQYLRDEAGSFHLIMDGKRIPINGSRDNYDMAGLMVDACGVTTHSAAAQAAIQRLQVIASRSTDGLRLRRFSAMSDDQERIYFPVREGRLLQISKDRVTKVENGCKPDSFWVEHPYEDPLWFADVEPTERLADFESLLVDTQACTLPAMKWFVAMAEGLFPFVRDAVPNRLIVVHLGPSQSGKTSGAKRFTLLHGLGDVKGDYSVAALGNMPDPGLLVLDNKEQSNFSQPLIDYCLFLATGAERGRSNSDGELRTSGTRPVAAITTIEGVPKTELQKRCVTVEYTPRFPMLKRGPIELEISKLRHKIGSALIVVLQRYLVLRGTKVDLPNPIPEFEEHFIELCTLLFAYADVAGKPAAWAQEIVDVWDETFKIRQEIDENELEHPIMRALKEGAFDHMAIDHDGQAGRLYYMTCGELLTALQKLNLRDLKLPTNASGLGNRLRSSTFSEIVMLDKDSAPQYECLKRTSKARLVGFFVADHPERELRSETPQL